eukprot:TRINITY_DN7649_c0_g1_i6.p1 TRINITY_DN7649_c0_g1~~TRINITY_DN7649_c0_g1_i6.p1  ORF type:complete len:315 (-),score=39.86 TRINITY_DN7649_c0_g1_i6:89-1033(-)
MSSASRSFGGTRSTGLSSTYTTLDPRDKGLPKARHWGQAVDPARKKSRPPPSLSSASHCSGDEGWVLPQHISAGLVKKEHLPRGLRKLLEAESPQEQYQRMRDVEGGRTQKLLDRRRKHKKDGNEFGATQSTLGSTQYGDTFGSFASATQKTLGDTASSLGNGDRFDALENTRESLALEATAENWLKKVPLSRRPAYTPGHVPKQYTAVQGGAGEPGILRPPGHTYVVPCPDNLSKTRGLTTYQRLHNTKALYGKTGKLKKKSGPWAKRPAGPEGSWAAWGQIYRDCLLYTSDAADEEDSVDLGGRRIIKKKKK